MIKELIAIYEQVRSKAEEHLKHQYRVTKIKAYNLDMEYYPPEKAFGTFDPPVFPLGRVDMSFKVDAVKLPLRYDPDESELTIDMVEDQLIVRKTVYIEKLPKGWLVLEGN